MISNIKIPSDVNLDENRVFEAFSLFKKRVDSLEIWYPKVFENAFLEEIEKFYNDRKNNYKEVCVVWIWWSALWTKAVYDAIKWEFCEKKLSVLDNVDPEMLDDFFKSKEIKNTLFIVISKSWTTLETLCLFEIIKSKFDEKALNYKDNFVVIAWKNTDLYKISKQNFLPVFEVPENIWGRFSVLSPVWILPLIFLWTDVEKLLSWADKLSKSFFEDKTFLGIFCSIFSKYEKGKTNFVSFFYADRMFTFWEWMKQLFCESLWKDGKTFDFTSSIWTTDQHSQLQLYEDGADNKVFLFIWKKYSDKNFDVSNFTLNDLFEAEKRATFESLQNSWKSVFSIDVEKIDEENVWELIIFFELMVSILWELMQINPYNQPWVESSKILTHKYMQEKFWEHNILKNIFW